MGVGITSLDCLPFCAWSRPISRTESSPHVLRALPCASLAGPSHGWLRLRPFASAQPFPSSALLRHGAREGEAAGQDGDRAAEAQRAHLPAGCARAGADVRLPPLLLPCSLSHPSCTRRPAQLPLPGPEARTRGVYLRSIYKIHDEKDKTFELELSWVCEESGWCAPAVFVAHSSLTCQALDNRPPLTLRRAHPLYTGSTRGCR